MVLPNFIENLPTPTVTFQIQLYFPTTARTFELYSPRFQFELSDCPFFPTAFSNYMHPAKGVFNEVLERKDHSGKLKTVNSIRIIFIVKTPFRLVAFEMLISNGFFIR